MISEAPVIRSIPAMPWLVWRPAGDPSGSLADLTDDVSSLICAPDPLAGLDLILEKTFLNRAKTSRLNFSGLIRTMNIVTTKNR
jgi:hypothetical protein